MHTTETDQLRDLLQNRSIRKGDFTLASGAKSNYYCDTKATVQSPEGARLIGRALYDLAKGTGAEAVGGLAMGSVFLSTAVAYASAEAHAGDSASPLLYGFTVRKQAKDHGTARQIDESWFPEGTLLAPGRKVVVVDDVVTSAGSILQAIDSIEEIGCEIVMVAAVVDRQAGGADRIRERGLRFESLYLCDTNGDLATSPAGA